MNLRFSRFGQIVLLTLGLPLLTPSKLPADDSGSIPDRPSWYCLPEETVGAFRIPDGKALKKALTENTKLGALLLADDRIERIKKLITQENREQWEMLRGKLAEYGLAPEDFLSLLAGESGYAVVLQPGDKQPYPAGLGWLEPGEKLAELALEAIGKAVDDTQDSEHPIERVDAEVDGQAVIQLTLPITETEHGAVDFEFPDNFGELTEKERQEIMQQWQAAQQEARQETTKFSQVVLTRLGGRVLIAHSLQPAAEEDQEEDRDRLLGIFSRFLAAHSDNEGGDDEKGFVSRVMTTSGLTDALPENGVTAVELLVDLEPLLRLAAEATPDPDTPRVFKALGLDQLGAVAARVTLDDVVLRTGMFLAAPAPRRGLLALLEQPAISPIPPAWVPASVISYSRTSADLGKIYSQVKKLVTKEFGEQAETAFQQAEDQVKATAGADLETVLSALGDKHIVLNFEPNLQQRQQDELTPVNRTQRMALVWQVKDERIWTQLLQKVADFQPLFQNALQKASEQGFEGWRVKQQGAFEGGIVLGKGFLVLAIGEGVLESTLSTLNNAPKNADALKSGKVYASAESMLKLQNCLSFQIVDGNRNTKMMRRSLDASFEQLQKLAEIRGGDDTPFGPGEFLGKLRKVLPTEKELENVLGASASYAVVNQNGLVIDSATELPAP